jgi:hypothetical protein
LESQISGSVLTGIEKEKAKNAVEYIVSIFGNNITSIVDYINLLYLLN